MEDLSTRVIDQVARTLMTRPALLSPDTELVEDLRLDDEERSELAWVLATDFCVAINDDTFASFSTLGDVIRHIDDSLSSRPPTWGDYAAIHAA